MTAPPSSIPSDAFARLALALACVGLVAAALLPAAPKAALPQPLILTPQAEAEPKPNATHSRTLDTISLDAFARFAPSTSPTPTPSSPKLPMLLALTTQGDRVWAVFASPATGRAQQRGVGEQIDAWRLIAATPTSVTLQRSSDEPVVLRLSPPVRTNANGAAP